MGRWGVETAWGLVSCGVKEKVREDFFFMKQYGETGERWLVRNAAWGI